MGPSGDSGAAISRQRALYIAAAACVALFVAAYANSIHNSFHFDDDHVIERNLHLRDLRNIPKFFTDARTFSVFPQNATYRPLVSVTLAVDYAVGGGLNPVPFHVTQLLLFACVGLLFFYVVRRLLYAVSPDTAYAEWIALFAATLFCVHTGNTQPGNYISARSELLCAIGVLGAYAVYLRWPKARAYGVYLLPMLLGALAKPPAVVFAALLLLHKCFFEQDLSLSALRTGEGWKKVARALVQTLPAFVLGAVMFKFVEGMNPPGQSYGGGDRLQYLWTQAMVWLRYVGIFFVPHGLSADTDIALLPTWKDPLVFAGVAVCVASLGAALVLTNRKELRPAALGVLWFWIGILPTSVVPLAEVTNDHRMFLGYLGLCLTVASFAAVVLTARPAWTKPAAVVAGAVLAAHAVGTHLRNKAWVDEESLWADTVEKSPQNGRAWMNYGLTQMRKGEMEKAKELFERAATLVPNYPVLEINRGIVRSVLHERDAEAHFLRALELAPNYAPGHYYYARFLLAQGQGATAEKELRTAIQIDGGDPNPRHELMNLLAAKGDAKGERALAEETLRLGQDDEAARHALQKPPFAPQKVDGAGWYELGLAYTQRGEHVMAAQAYRQAVQQERTNGDAWNNLGWSLQSLGFVNEAHAAYEKGLVVQPDHERMKNNMAVLERRLAGGITP